MTGSCRGNKFFYSQSHHLLSFMYIHILHVRLSSWPVWRLPRGRNVFLLFFKTRNVQVLAKTGSVVVTTTGSPLKDLTWCLKYNKTTTKPMNICALKTDPLQYNLHRQKPLKTREILCKKSINERLQLINK